MKVKSIILSMAVVVLFMIAMGNSFGRNVNYPVNLPGGYVAHFYNWKGNNNSTLSLNGKEICKLPKEPYWMTKSNKDLICFMDDQDYVYVGQIYWTPIMRPGLVLYKTNLSTGKGKWQRIADSAKLIDGFGWNMKENEREIYLLWHLMTPLERGLFTSIYGLPVGGQFLLALNYALVGHEMQTNQHASLEAKRLSDGRYHIDHLGERKE